MERDFAPNDRLRVEGTANLVAAAAGGRAPTHPRPEHRLLLRPGPAGHGARRADPLLAPEQAAGPVQPLARAIAELEAACSAPAAWCSATATSTAAGARSRGTARSARSLPAAAPDRGRRRRRVVVHPRRRRRLGDRDGALRAGPEGAEHRRRRAGPRVGVDPGPRQALGAPAPRRVPALLARLARGLLRHRRHDQLAGSRQHRRPRRAPGWSPRYPSWREGFRTAL